MSIKEVIRKKILGKHPLSDYIAIGSPTLSETKEDTYWVFKKNKIKVTARCVLYDPTIIGIFFSDEKPKDQMNTEDVCFLEYYNNQNDNCIGSITLQFENIISVDETNKIYLFLAKDADLKLTTYRLKIISQLIYFKLRHKHKSFLSSFNSKHYRTLSALFTHPRLVRLLTIPIDENNRRYFPIDLYLQVKNSIVFGLRNSNNSNIYLKKGAVLCLSDVLMQHKSKVYSLGKFGAKTNDQINFVPTEYLKIRIPDLFFSYVEIKIEKVFTYENQTIYQAEVLNQFYNQKNKEELLLSHIQLLRYLKQPLNYTHKVI
ncbi:hypothetical protein [Aquimarina sp. 2201CG14-23]|uniref:hypothetical protein n=1 Tax=Aquimarina mycalae TaxID=3040073 RepID=UPI00247818B4|nr:hypothetical protein [Aquimarina sp. 2201CG14-23]MDH7448052.1 hypothetical protein [Aquimarina sp. 2201CG14-23]